MWVKCPILRDKKAERKTKQNTTFHTFILSSSNSLSIVLTIPVLGDLLEILSYKPWLYGHLSCANTLSLEK